MKLSERIDKLLPKFVNVPLVENNHVVLAQFVQRFFRFYQFWNDGKVTVGRIILAWFIFLVTNTVLFVSLAHVVRYSMHADRFNYHEVSSDFPLIGAIPGVMLTFALFFHQQKRLQALVYEMGNFENYEKPHGIELHEAKSEALLKLCMIILAMPVPPLLARFIMEECPDPEDYKCGFMYPAYFPGCMTSGNRKVCAVFLIYLGYSESYICFLISAFYCQLSEYIVIYLKHFHEMLKQIPKIQDSTLQRRHVLKSLRYHQRILELYDAYHLIVKQVFLIHVFVTPVILAMSAFTFLTDFKVQNFAYSLLWIFSLLFVCLIGQRMVDESEKIADVAYESIPWNGDSKIGTDLMLLMLRSQRPLNTPAGSLTYCGNGLFVAVMKTTYSYLAVLQSTGATEI